MAYIREVPEKLIGLVQSGNAQVYGSIIKDTSTGKILGHLEETGITNIATGVATGNPLSTVTGVTKAVSSVVGNVQNQKMIRQLTQISTQLTSVAALGWANIGLSAITLGATVVGTVAISKKLNVLNKDIKQISSKLDNIDLKLVAIQMGVNRLNENEIRKLNREYMKLIDDMLSMTEDLNINNYSEYRDREAKKLLHTCKAFLNDMIGRYVDSFEIMITMEQLMSFFAVYTSYSKVLMSKSYLSTDRVLNPLEYQDPLRNMCSNNIINTLNNQVRNSAKSVILPSKLDLITTAYKTTVAEQVKSIKSSEQIIGYLPYNEYAFISQELQSISNKEIAYVEYN